MAIFKSEGSKFWLFFSLETLTDQTFLPFASTSGTELRFVGFLRSTLANRGSPSTDHDGWSNIQFHWKQGFLCFVCTVILQATPFRSFPFILTDGEGGWNKGISSLKSSAENCLKSLSRLCDLLRVNFLVLGTRAHPLERAADSHYVFVKM